MKNNWNYLKFTVVSIIFLNDTGLWASSDQLKVANNSTADILLGVLFPIHETGINLSSDCGRIQLEDGIQPFEALLFTMKTINEKNIIPGVSLGVIALDSCDNVVHALEQSLNFIKGFVSKLNEHEQNEFSCGDGTIPQYRSGMYNRVVGIIGGQSSQVSIQLANLLRIFHVPQISYLSSSPTLSNREMFSYFFRTVPSDINQVVTILKILQYFDWTYVSMVYTNTDYGNKGLEELEKLAPKYNVCFATPQRINVDKFADSDYDHVVRNLMFKSSAKVVIMFLDKRSARQLMTAVKRQRVIGRFVWIGSDGWSGRHTVADGQEEVIEGAITVQPLWGHLSGFDDYFTSRRPNETPDNPWFNEFWEEYFKCRLSGSVLTLFNERYPPCNPKERISVAKGYRQQTYLHFVRDAVYAFAYALRDLHHNQCHGQPGFCPQMKKYLDEKNLKQYLEKVSFNDEMGKKFRFQKNGDGPPRYSILNYQKLSSGSYAWVAVGSYMSEDGGPQLPVIDKAAMKFAGGSPHYPSSYCSEPCKQGQTKIQQEGESCCWVCTNCSTNQYLSTEHNSCQECSMGTLPNADKTSCLAIDEEYLDYDNPYAIAAMAVTGLGLMLTVGIGLVFWVYSNTPVVKAAGRELSYVHLCGIFLSYAITFILVAKPTAVKCGIARFFLGFCYTLCYAAVVTKTNRIARIFNAKYNTPRKARYISPRSQVAITACLTSIEVVINGIWLLVQTPRIVNTFPSREENLLICYGSDNASYLVGLIYPFVLICFCTVYAFKTRKCPDGFNEALFVAFTNYTTCVVWLAFVALYFSSTSSVKRTLTLSFSLSLAATVQLGCLFLPKIYTVLFKPEKNTKDRVMSQHRLTVLPLPLSSLGIGTSPTVFLNGNEFWSRVN